MNTGVAHLIDVRNAGWAGVDALTLVARRGDTVYSTGRCETLDQLRERGVVVVRLSPARSAPELGWRALRAALRGAPPALLHAWTTGDLLLARLAAPSAARIATVFDAPRRGLTPMRARARSAFIGARSVSFAGESLRNAWAALDTAVANAPAPAPPVDAAATPAASREEVRRAWGVRGDDQRVVAFVGARSGATDARMATHLIGLLMLSGENPICVLAPGAHGLERATRYTRRLGGPWRLNAEARPVREWMHGADLCVACSPHADARPLRTSHDVGDALPALAWAFARRTPVVSQDAPGVRTILDETCATLVPEHDHAALARALGASNHATDAAHARIEAGAARVARRCDPAQWRRHVDALWDSSR